MIKSKVCDLLGIEYPLFQGGMAWIADGKLAAAVSNGGGLGIIAAGNAPGDYVREQIHIARKETDKPFGVNIMLLSPFADEVAAVVAEEKVAVVTTGAGNPGKYMEMWKSAGIKVIPVVASVAMAKLMTRLGASALIAEGGESGGHVGETSTMPLVPQVCDATDLPVIAAGGIADGRGVAAAFMLGACGVQIGTRFLVAEECNIHREYKQEHTYRNSHDRRNLAEESLRKSVQHHTHAHKMQYTEQYRAVCEERHNERHQHTDKEALHASFYVIGRVFAHCARYKHEHSCEDVADNVKPAFKKDGYIYRVKIFQIIHRVVNYHADDRKAS